MTVQTVWRDRWTTTDEVQFLRGIGTYRLGEMGSPAPPAVRLELLEGYRASLLSRVDWGEMDPVRITEVVEELLHAARLQILREPPAPAS